MAWVMALAATLAVGAIARTSTWPSGCGLHTWRTGSTGHVGLTRRIPKTRAVVSTGLAGVVRVLPDTGAVADGAVVTDPDEADPPGVLVVRTPQDAVTRAAAANTAHRWYGRVNRIIVII